LQDEFEDMLGDVNYMQDSMTRSYGIPDDLDEEALESGKR
jgi:hypothetical protein